jgi:hypothetical protein
MNSDFWKQVGDVRNTLLGGVALGAALNCLHCSYKGEFAAAVLFLLIAGFSFVLYTEGRDE